MPRLLVVFALLLSIGLAMANTCRWAGVASQADEQDDSYQFCNETTGEVLVDELDQSVLTVPLGPFSYGTCEKFEPQLTDEQVQEEYDLAVRPYFKGDLVRDPSDPQNEALLLIDQFGDPGCTFSQRRVTLRFGKQADICKQAQATSQGVATEIYFNTMDDCQVFAAADQTTQDQIARDSWKGSSNTIEGFENTLFDPLPLLQQFAQTVNPNLRYSTENKVQEKSFTQQPNWQHDNSYCYGVGEFIEPPFHIPVIFKNPNNTNMHLFRNDIAIPGTDFRGDGFLCFESCHQTIVDIINSNPTEPFLWPLHFANSTCGRFYELFNAYNASNANVPSDYGLGAGNYALASLFLEIWQPRPCNV